LAGLETRDPAAYGFKTCTARDLAGGDAHHNAKALRAVLTGIRRLLGAHPKVEAESAATRFVRFSGTSLDIEISAYVLERDQRAFLAVQEDLLLGILDVVDASGSSIASPVRAVGLADVAISLPTRTGRDLPR